MKKIIIAFLITTLAGTATFAQSNIDSVLANIEKHNTSLEAYKMHIDAEKIGNKTGIFLQNPEVEFNYLWSNPNDIGNRIDLRITQSFDYPTVYGSRSQISDMRNEQAILEYEKHLRDILLQARLLCIDLIYTNAMKNALLIRSKHAESIALAYETKFEAGETNILDLNKARLNHLIIYKELESVETQRKALLMELSSLNGGNFIEFTDSIFLTPAIPVDFEQWYLMAEQSNPDLNWLKMEEEISRQQERLYKATSLPKFEAGYMSERIIGEKFQGIALGLTIPLYENKNTVKYARASTLASESIAKDRKVILYNQLKALHSQAADIQASVADYRKQLQSFDSKVLLHKSFDNGEISLIEYIFELGIYYESVNNFLDMERKLNKALSVLNQYN